LKINTPLKSPLDRGELVAAKASGGGGILPKIGLTSKKILSIVKLV
jgi:hypothetical protein